MSDMKVLPGLKQVVEFGYNAVSGTFAGASVFDLTYDDGQTRDFPDGSTYLVPDGVNADTQSQGTYTSSTTDLLETSSDYDEYFSASVSGSGSYMSYSASASSSVAFRGSLFQQENKYYAANFGISKIYWAQRNENGPLDPAFASALAALPPTCSTGQDFDAYFTFFEKYGTHFFQSGAYGCYFAMQTAIDSSYVEETSQTDITASIEGAFTSMTGSGKISASMAAGYVSTDTETQSHYSFEFFSCGGDASLLPMSSDETTTTGAFYQSAYKNPIMLIDLEPSAADAIKPAKVAPLSDLLDGIDVGGKSDRVVAYADALQAYIDRSAEADGVLSNPKDVQPDDTDDDFGLPQQTASGDMFVIATMTRNTKTDGDRAMMTLASDSLKGGPNDYPTTVRAVSSMSYHSSNDTHLFVSSLTTPVRKGDAWSLQYDRTCQHPIVEIATQRLQLTNGASFGAWQTIAANSTSTSVAPMTATTPGLVVGNFTCNANGARGALKGSLKAPGASGVTLYAAASASYDTSHDAWVNLNSFCMPVPAGYQYSLSASITGAATWSAYWLPLLDDPGLIGAPLVDDLQVKQAETDGFLVGTIGGFNNGNRGWVKVYLSDDPDDLVGDAYEDIHPVLATCVDYDTDHHLWVQYNSVCLPVPRGRWFRAVVETKDQGSPPADIFRRVTWFPLVQTPIDPE